MTSPLTELYDEDAKRYQWLQLLNHCEKVFKGIEINPEMAKCVEESTRDQAEADGWFMHRIGRITASKMKSACRTDLAYPSVSVIESICAPVPFKNVAMRWGCDNEGQARDAYTTILQQKHDRATVSDSGLWINPLYPHIGASPDGMVHCKCCGHGVCEIKCPYSSRDKTIEEMSAAKTSYMIKNENGEITLDKTHAYYYQVQTQMHVCGVEYCDFVVWTVRDLHVERIAADKSFWDTTEKQATRFFKTAILPELTVKWFTTNQVKPSANTGVKADACTVAREDDPSSRSTIQAQAQPSTSESINYSTLTEVCYCVGPQYDPMVRCRDPECPRKLFHYNCLKISKAPRKKEWKCPDCRRKTFNVDKGRRLVRKEIV